MHWQAATPSAFNPMLRDIRIYGKLAECAGQGHFRAEVGSVAEAVKFLLANFPRLEKVLADGEYIVRIGSRSIDEEELHHPMGARAIRIIPVVCGAGAVGRILLGVTLVAASFFIGGAFAPFFFNLGVGLTLGGVAQLLSPVPKQDPIANDPKSFSFSGVQQNAREGLPVPIVYGRMVVGSLEISKSITTNNEVLYVTLPAANP